MNKTTKRRVRIEEISERAEHAFRGPWFYRRDEVPSKEMIYTKIPCYGGDTQIGILANSFMHLSEGIGDFIANSRSDVPWLVLELKKEIAKNHRLESTLHLASQADFHGWSVERISTFIKGMMSPDAVTDDEK